MRRLVPIIALSACAFASQAQAQQSPANSPATTTLPGTVAPGPAATGVNPTAGSGAASSNAMPMSHAGSSNRSFHARFKAAAPDDHLTLDQAKAAGFTRTANAFSKIDSSNKGYVTYSQVIAYFRAQQNAQPGGKGNH